MPPDARARTASLPSAADEDWVLDELAVLIEARGAQTFIAAPLLRPEREYFPDPWEQNEAGVRRLARRLMMYAGLGDRRVEVEVFAANDPRARIEGTTTQHAGAWFAGVHDGTCWFGVADTLLADAASEPEHFVGVMAHEVAHAYRAVHGLVVEDHDVEEKLTDLTTVYLGFGLFTVNAALVYRRTAAWSSRRAGGYLPPKIMGFLLAAQVSARGLAAAERHALANELEGSQFAFFEASLGHLAKRDLRGELGLPAPVAGQAPSDLAPQPPLPPDLPAAPPGARPLAFGARAVTYATGDYTRAFQLGVLGLLGAGLTALVLDATIDPDAPVTEITFWSLWLGAIAVGLAKRTYHCAVPGCRARMPRRAGRCPACGARVSR